MIRKAVILLTLIYTAGLAAVWMVGYRETPPLVRLDDQCLYLTSADEYLMICYDIRGRNWRDADYSEYTDDRIARHLAGLVRHRELFLTDTPSPLYYHGPSMQVFCDDYTLISLWIFALPVAAVFLGSTAFACRRALRRYRRCKRNRCVGCGYDLTGNVSGTCPECGELA